MKKLLLLFIFLFSFTASIFAVPNINPAHAQWDALLESCDTVDKKGNPGGSVVTLDCVPQLFANVIYWALIFSTVVAVYIIIISGIKFITSGGDPKQTEGARKTLMWAIIGLLLVLLSFGILRIIADVTGVGCITKFGFTQCVPRNAFKCSNQYRTGWCTDGKFCARKDPTVYKCVECNTANGKKTSQCSGSKKVCKNSKCVECTKVSHCPDVNRYNCTNNKCVRLPGSR